MCTSVQCLRKPGLHDGDHTGVIKNEEFELNKPLGQVAAGHGDMQQDRGTARPEQLREHI